MLISWSPPDEGGYAFPLTGYIVRWKSHSSYGSEGEKYVTSKSASIFNLTSNTQYNVTVAVFGMMGEQKGEISDLLQVITCK